MNKSLLFFILVFLLVGSVGVLAEICVSVPMVNNGSFKDFRVNKGAGADNCDGIQSVIKTYGLGTALQPGFFAFDEGTYPDDVYTINNVSIRFDFVIANGNTFSLAKLDMGFDDVEECTGGNPWALGNASWNSPKDGYNNAPDNGWPTHTFWEQDNVLLESGSSSTTGSYVTFVLDNSAFEDIWNDGHDGFVLLFNCSVASECQYNIDGKAGGSVPIVDFCYDIAPVNDPPVIDWDNEFLEDGHAINESSEVFYFFNCSDADNDSLSVHIDLDGVSKNSSYDFANGINQSLSFLSGDLIIGNHTVTLTCDDGIVNITATKVLRWDGIPPDIPLIGQSFPLGDNSSIAPDPTNVPLNSSCGDEGLLWSFQINATDQLGWSEWSFYQEDLGVSNFTYDTPVDFFAEGYSNGTVTMDYICYDSHTANWIHDYYTYVDLESGTLGYNTYEGNTVIVMLEDSSNLIGLKTEKQYDRYDFDYTFNTDRITEKEYSFYVQSDNKLIYLKDSKYEAHFVTVGNNGGNWIDFELEGKTNKPKVEKIDDYTYKVTIKTKLKNLKFKSHGALNTGYNSATFQLGNQAPTVPDIISPANETSVDNSTIFLLCNGSTDPESNPFFYEYFGDNNNPPTTALGNSSGVLAWNLTTSGDQWWRCRACDFYSCSDYNVTRFIYSDYEDIKSVDQHVSLAQISTGYYYYELNLTYNDIRYSSAAAVLDIDGVEVSLTKEIINSTSVKFYTSLSAESSWEGLTVPYFWNISLINFNGSTYYNTTYGDDISIETIEFKICNETSPQTFINFTFKDESDNSALNSSIPSSSFIYSIDPNKAATKSYSFTETLENSSYAFCGFSSDKTLYVTPSMEYKMSGYPQRSYTDDLILSNATTNKTLYLLSSDSGLYVTFQLVNTVDESLPGVEVLAERVIGSTFETMDYKITDAAGGATLWLNPDFSHRLTFTKAEYETYTISINPTQGSYTITLSPLESIEDENYAIGISYEIQPSIDTLKNNSDYNFNLTINSTYYILQEAGFNLVNASGDIIGSASCSEPSSCIASTTVNTGINNTEITLDFYWLVNDTYVNKSRYYSVTVNYAGKAALVNLVVHVKKLGDSFSSITNFKFTKAIIAFLMTMLITLTLVYSLNFKDNDVAISAIIFACTLFFDITGFIAEFGRVEHLVTVFVFFILLYNIISEYYVV